MSNPEADAAKEYAEAGVDLEELKATEEPTEPAPAEPAEPEPEPTEPAEPEGQKPTEPAATEEPTEPLQDTQTEPRKRSIYDEYKDKKAEVKDFRALATDLLKSQGIEITGNETAEELRAKVASAPKPETPAQTEQVSDELEAFAKKINADPATLREMQAIFLKSAPGLSPELQEQINAATQFHKQNSEAFEQQQFEKEYSTTVPTIKELFPNASDEEMAAIKTEVDKLAHSKEGHDKELNYLVWKHKESLGKLVSPKTRGLEPRDRKDGPTGEDTFDPEADLSQMTPKQLEAWTAEYEKRTSGSNGLATDGEGRKIII